MKKPILIGETAICDYIGISKGTLFRALLKKGLPARQINSRWYAHAENIDDFFRKFTKVRNRAESIPD
jgi:hypothetical protein